MARGQLTATREWLALMGEDVAAVEKMLGDYVAPTFVQRRLDATR